MPKTGVLSAKTFTPQTGDVLRDEENGISWQCVRANSYTTNKGVTIRYGVLEGYCPDYGNGEKPLFEVWNDTTMPVPFLDNIVEVVRTKGERATKYRKNDKGNFQEVT